MVSRPSIPEELKRSVLVEAGHRCSIPSCRHTTVEIAHIIPFSECKEHKFENLIALCPNCHTLYDRDKKIDRKSMERYKSNLSILNSRYSSSEMRLIYLWVENENRVFSVSDNDIWQIEYLIRDGLCAVGGGGGVFIRGVSVAPRSIELTEKGRAFVSDFR